MRITVRDIKRIGIVDIGIEIPDTWSLQALGIRQFNRFTRFDLIGKRGTEHHQHQRHRVLDAAPPPRAG